MRLAEEESKDATDYYQFTSLIRQHYSQEDRQAIVATLTHRLSNARMEGANTTIRLITRRAYGFKNAGALIALATVAALDQRQMLDAVRRPVASDAAGEPSAHCRDLCVRSHRRRLCRRGYGFPGIEAGAAR